jgi:hypothetical protein
VGSALVLRYAVGSDVPAAIVTRGGLVKAAIAVKRPPVKELFKTLSIFGREVTGFAR